MFLLADLREKTYYFKEDYFRKSLGSSCDYWQCAKETLKFKVGDCKYIAIFKSYLAEDFNYLLIIMLLKSAKLTDYDKDFIINPEYSNFPELIDKINFYEGLQRLDNFRIKGKVLIDK